MTHYMKLNEEQFKKIKAGSKRVELRLNDEKRRKLRRGHRITFKALTSGSELSVEVLSLRAYRDFRELYEDYGAQALGYDMGQDKDPRDMLEIYSQKDIEKYGALAIEIRLL